MGNWVKVEKPKDDGNPCVNCNVAWSNYSSKEIDGEMYSKVDHCQETCQQYKMWLKLTRPD